MRTANLLQLINSAIIIFCTFLHHDLYRKNFVSKAAANKLFLQKDVFQEHVDRTPTSFPGLLPFSIFRFFANS